MKLLDWMHRKFRQNNDEPLKEFAIGQPSLDDLQYYPKSNYYVKPSSKTQRDNQLRRSFASLEAARAEADNLEEDSSNELSELFHGFLAIGTLGTDAIATDPSTPTFAISFQNITEKETDATENELKLINDELEKVLGSEGKDYACNDSSARNSYASIGRSSQGSTITLSGKLLEGIESNENVPVACPLQGYLFGSAIGLPETSTGKKEQRTSLAELFQKTKMIEESSGAKCDKGEKRPEKGNDKSAVHLMKKMLKKRMLHNPSRHSTAASGGNVDSHSAEKMVHKILQKFHKKVHPESSTEAHKSSNPTKYEVKSEFNVGGYTSGNQVPPDEDISIFPQGTVTKRGTKLFKNQSKLPLITHSTSGSNGNRECWIKSDADYLVLEL